MQSWNVATLSFAHIFQKIVNKNVAITKKVKMRIQISCKMYVIAIN